MKTEIDLSSARTPGARPQWRHLLAVLAFIGCLRGNSPEPLPPGGIHVLFVGNSLTYVNDLPGMVQATGAAVGETIRVSSAVGADLALIDHLNGATNAVEQIKLGGWQFVVLQQGPSSLQVSRDSLILWTRMFDPIVRAAGAQTALYMVWPSIDRVALFDDVRVSYQQAAQAVSGVFMPAGAA